MSQHMKLCFILSYKELILACAGYHLVLLIVSRALFDFWKLHGFLNAVSCFRYISIYLDIK